MLQLILRAKLPGPRSAKNEIEKNAFNVFFEIHISQNPKATRAIPLGFFIISNDKKLRYFGIQDICALPIGSAMSMFYTI